MFIQSIPAPQSSRERVVSTLELIMSAWLIVAIIRHTSGSAVHLTRDRIRDVAELLLLLLKVFGSRGGRVLFQPILSFFDCLEDL